MYLDTKKASIQPDLPERHCFNLYKSELLKSTTVQELQAVFFQRIQHLETKNWYWIRNTPEKFTTFFSASSSFLDWTSVLLGPKALATNLADLWILNIVSCAVLKSKALQRWQDRPWHGSRFKSHSQFSPFSVDPCGVLQALAGLWLEQGHWWDVELAIKNHL